MSYIDIMRQLQQTPLEERPDEDTGLIKVMAGLIKNVCESARKHVGQSLQDILYGDLREELIELFGTAEGICGYAQEDSRKLVHVIDRLRLLIDQLEPKSDPTPQSPAAVPHICVPADCTS